MRKLLGFLLLLVAVSCEEPLLESLPRYMREQNRVFRAEKGGRSPADTNALEPGMPEPQEPPVHEPSVYASALDFGASVNWRKDSLVQAHLLFFKDGVLERRLPVPIPPDPERHRIRDGHLWIDVTDGVETVIFRDGEEQFRFEGEEHLQGFLLVNGDVHTLGQRPGRDGFCYRINGEPVFESPEGSVLGSPSDPEWPGGALVLDGEDVYYSYSLPVTLKNRIDREYRVMKGALTYRIIPAGTSEALYDLRVFRGRVYRLERRGSSIYWLEEAQERVLNLFLSSIISCKLVRMGDSVTVRGLTRSSGSSCVNWYFVPGSGAIQPVVTGQSERGCLVLLEDNWAFADIGPDGRFLSLQGARTPQSLPGGDFTLATSTGLFLSEEHYALALTHLTGSTHTVLSDLGTTTYSFNGYFTSVRIE